MSKPRQIPLSREAAAKLVRLVAAEEAARQQVLAFLSGYLAAQGIDEAVVEQIDLVGQMLVVRDASSTSPGGA